MAEQQKLTDVKVLLLDPRKDDAQNLPTFQYKIMIIVFYQETFIHIHVSGFQKPKNKESLTKCPSL